ncbi:MAG: SPFH domain-containing protein [bacterium]|nr:SPFH domain-containing protein [bacterium]
MKAPGAVSAFVLILILLFLALVLFIWYGCRIEVPSGEMVVLIKKTGKNLPPGAIIAPDPSYKGIQLEPLPEGRYFRNPLFWDWKFVKITTVPAGHVGVVTRLYGRDLTADDLAAGRLFAHNGEKGLLREPLTPGNYRINPYAYRVELFPAVEVPAGFVGIVTELAGKTPQNPNVFVVKPGERGVQPDVLQPGTYYVNPYAQRIDLMDVRSQRHEMYGENALRFPTSDGFDMRVLLVVEWAVDPKRAPEVLVRIGEMGATEESNEILQKIVVPAIRGFGRIIGSQYSSIDYISGMSRIVFQSNLFERVRTTCASKGIEIKSVLIADIDPPEEIAQALREREIAKEELARNEAQIAQARADQSLAETEALIQQQRRKVEAETEKLQAVIAATNDQLVALVNQEQKLVVARTDLEAAQREAEAVRARGKAQADVILLGHKADAAALSRAAQAFGSGDKLASYELIRALAQRLKTFFTSDDTELGKIITPNNFPSPSP